MAVDLTTTQEYSSWPAGMLVTPADLLGLQQNVDNAIGLLLRALGGTNFLPNVNPITVAPGTGMAVVVGGPNQWVIAQGRELDSITPQTIAVNPAGATDRIDLIAIKASRVAGSQTTLRNVLAQNAPTGIVTQRVALVAGTATVMFSNPFTGSPICAIGVEGNNTNGARVYLTIAPNQVVITSTDNTDTRNVDLIAYGVQTGSLGVATNVRLLENQPVLQYVAGTSASAPPQPPNGFEAFATVRVRANASIVYANDVAILFPQLASPILDATFRNMTTTSLNTTTLTTLSRATIQGNGTDGYGALVLQDSYNLGNAPIKRLRANGISGTFEIVNAAAAAVILSLTDTGFLFTPTAGFNNVDSYFRMTAQGNGLDGLGQFVLIDSVNNSNAPVKRLRANGSNGCLEVVNAGGNAVIFELNDVGGMAIFGPLYFGTTSRALFFDGTNYQLTGAQSFITGRGVFGYNGQSAFGQVQLYDNVNTGGAYNKFLRSNGLNGCFEVINNAANAVIFQVDDNGNVYIPGSLNVAGRVLNAVKSINGATGAVNLYSSDGSIAIGSSGGQDAPVNIILAQQTRTFGGNVITDAYGNASVQVPFRIIGATGNVGVSAGSSNPYIVIVDQQSSNFAGGRVVFRVVTGGGLGQALGGAGIYYTIVTTNVAHA